MFIFYNRNINFFIGVSVEINEIPAAAEASTFSWSPKGKQIAVGSKKGTITQYKPDLKAVRMINAPPLGEPVSLISLQWISNYQFIGLLYLCLGFFIIFVFVYQVSINLW